MSNASNFYRAFEDRYRGSRELILGRLQLYLDFLAPLKGLFRNAAAVDLGCGRGEFLEVLLSAGFKAKGVDLDAGMLRACTEKKLPAEKGDALAFLAKLPKQSQVVVSAFHVVEHMPFEQLQTLVVEAYRVLTPGGILILETPNPENITVATSSFYLDPTHQRPIPPLLLSFVGEYAGFERVKILRLQEALTLKEKQNVDLADVLSGASPDYSIVAQKAGSKKATEALDAAFAKDYGLTANELAARYENFHQRTIEQLGQTNLDTKSEIGAVHELIKSEAAEARARLEQMAGELGAARAEKEALTAEREKTGAELAEVRAEKNSLEAALAHQTNVSQRLSSERDQLRKEIESNTLSLQQAHKTLEDTKQELGHIHQANHNHWQLAEQRQQRIEELLQSTCWRITAPLRWVKGCLSGGPAERPRSIYLQDPLGHTIRYIVRRPSLKKPLRSVVRLFPSMERSLIEKRTAQLRGDFLAACEKSSSAGRAQMDIGASTFANQRWLESDGKDLTVEEILSRIRSQLG
jgi:SAM-dependent methyltransferase